jgi:hypothetical protein
MTQMLIANTPYLRTALVRDTFEGRSSTDSASHVAARQLDQSAHCMAERPGSHVH